MKHKKFSAIDAKSRLRSKFVRHARYDSVLLDGRVRSFTVRWVIPLSS